MLHFDGLPVKISPAPAMVEMVLVQGGSFSMGSTDDEVGRIIENAKSYSFLNKQWFVDEVPRHSYNLQPFYIDRYEVSNKQYRQFVKATKHPPPAFWSDPDLNSDDQPVVGVNWADADAFCWWAGKRMPTEAEWEKAARGTEARAFPWGKQWSYENSNNRLSGLGKPMPVGSYPQGTSPCGAMDMAGNVWEWCKDWYDMYIYRFPSKNRKARYNRSGFRVIRGGSYLDDLFEQRTSYRYRLKQEYYFVSVGFRCAMTPKLTFFDNNQ